MTVNSENVFVEYKQYECNISPKLGPEPESSDQKKPPFKWVGGETKALQLLSHRLDTEEDVSSI